MRDFFLSLVYIFLPFIRDKNCLKLDIRDRFLSISRVASGNHGAACIAFHCSNIIMVLLYWSNGRLYMQPHGGNYQLNITFSNAFLLQKLGFHYYFIILSTLTVVMPNYHSAFVYLASSSLIDFRLGLW